MDYLRNHDARVPIPGGMHSIFKDFHRADCIGYPIIQMLCTAMAYQFDTRKQLDSLEFSLGPVLPGSET